MNLKDSQTKINLMRAFAGESQARNRYEFAASVAKKEGLYIIYDAFNYTANQEKAHAKVFFKHLKEFNGTTISLGESEYPVDVNETILPHLKAAMQHEFDEFEEIYKDFAKVAKEEGFMTISNSFETIATIEKIHGDRFKRLHDELQAGSLFKKDTDVKWMCTNCGYVYEGKEAPKACPACDHPQGYFMLFAQTLFE